MTGSGKTFTIANIIQNLQRPTLIISQNKTLTAQLCTEFREFFPANEVHYFVSYYDYYQPEAYIAKTDTYIEKDASINDEIAKFRHAATKALLTRRDTIIVASVSCIYGLGDLEAYQNLAFTIKVGEKIARDDLLRKLIELQYTRTELDFKRGQFHVLGDLVEIYPPAAEHEIIRLDFFGNELEQITLADHFSGEILAERTEIQIFPAKHDATTPAKIARATTQIRAELAERLTFLKRLGKNLEAERLQTKTEYDLEMLHEVGYVSGIENYTRQLSGRPSGAPPDTLLDYFPKDFLTFIDESHVTVPQLGAMFNGNASRKRTLVEHGFRLPSCFDNRPLKFEEFEAHRGQTVFISATPADFELEQSGKFVTEMINRPTGLLDPLVTIRPKENQISEILQAIQAAVQTKERVLITTLTKKSAENLTEFLTEKTVRVRYLHSDIDTLDRLKILHDFRIGKFDVLIGINLLREGLDLPEVSTICILDADTEGFLRSARSLIQTMGRCARNVHGHVLLFANRETDAMRKALAETNRRRKIQTAYNKKHGITPQTIQKAVSELTLQKTAPKAVFEPQKIPTAKLEEVLVQLSAEMDLASQNLEFEKAAELRDEIKALEKLQKAAKKRIPKK